MPPAFQLTAIFIAFGLPFLAIAASGFGKRWLAYKTEVAKILGEQTAERAALYATKVERLEQRMAVLERILTDRGSIVGDEIERRRDRPIN